MESTEQPNSRTTQEPGFSYFEIQSFWGVTKHFGGLPATRELANLCHIDQHKHVLEVGCGVGISTCYLAGKVGCRVTAVDLSDKMIEWSLRRVKRRGLEDRVVFRSGDAQNLPFEDDLFDAVIDESVTAFTQDKQRTLNEYTRVTKPGGFVGLNEGTWVKGSPPADLMTFMDRMMANARFLTADEWLNLFKNSGLQDLYQQTFKMTMLRQAINERKGMELVDYLERLRAFRSFFSLLFTSQAFRKYAKELTPSPKIITNMFSYLGYGYYVGKKAVK